MAICGEMHALEEELLMEFAVQEADYNFEEAEERVVGDDDDI